MAILGVIAFGVGTIALVGVLMALPVMWIWNFLMPDLFHLPLIGFWQALCLDLLCGILVRPNISMKY
jgi:hypothetical protein